VLFKLEYVLKLFESYELYIFVVAMKIIWIFAASSEIKNLILYP